MNKNVSSEEKLLNLIRNKKLGPAAVPEEPDKDGGARRWSSFYIFFWKGGTVIFLIGAAVMLVLLVVKFQKANTSGPVMSEIPVGGSGRSGEKELSERIMTEDGRNYHEIIQARDIFSSPVEQRNEDERSSSSPVAAVSDRYKLSGIMLDNNPTAVIEDIQSHQTMIVSKGQRIDNFSVEEIKADRVLLKDGDQVVELAR